MDWFFQIGIEINDGREISPQRHGELGEDKEKGDFM